MALPPASAVLITSLQNKRIKNLVKLTKRRERDLQRVTVVEGLREINHALQAGVRPTEIYICPELVTNAETQVLVDDFTAMAGQGLCTQMFVTPEVFAKIAYRGDSGGLLMVAPYLNRPLSALPITNSPFFAVIEGVEKPGNLGAILRTADAAGIDGVIVCAGATDIHNPNVVRASLGALFTVPIAEAPTDKVIAWLREEQIRIIAATPDGKCDHTTPDLTGAVAIIMGSEAQGLQPVWLTAADELVRIPMQGVVDSLNLSAATAVMLYEVVRQRQQHRRG